MQLEARLRALEGERGEFDFTVFAWIENPENREAEIRAIVDAIEAETGIRMDFNSPRIHLREFPVVNNTDFDAPRGKRHVLYPADNVKRRKT